MLINPKKLAKHLIWYAWKEGRPLNNQTLAFMLVEINREHEIRTKKRLFPKDYKEWSYGIRIQEIYDDYSRYGVLPIIFNINPEDEFILKEEAKNGTNIELIYSTVDKHLSKNLWDWWKLYNTRRNNYEAQG